ncbi:MAG: type II secretion system F family protein [Chloroflexi bacterium]|nr:type II secretion system F family protein [Chloroflexota bacterium]
MTAAGAALSAIAVCCAIASLAVPASWAAHAMRHPERDTLQDAGMRFGSARWELLRAGTGGAATIGAVLLGAPALLGLLPGVVLPSVWLRMRAGERRRAARHVTAQLIRRIHSSLRSGTALADAMRRACDGESDPIARRPLDEALRSFAVGTALDRALYDVARRMADTRTRLALETMALGVAERLPIDRVASLVGAVSDRLVFDDRLDQEVRARSSGVRMQVWLLALVVPALVLYLWLTVPTLAASLDSTLGRTVLLPLAGALEVAGIVLARRIVNGALR